MLRFLIFARALASINVPIPVTGSIKAKIIIPSLRAKIKVID